MEFIREKIKEKPISKKRLAMKLGIAALCGLVFALVVCVVLIIAMPMIQNSWDSEGSEVVTESEVEESTLSTEEEQQNAIVFPPDFNLTISDYETLQNELYKIGQNENKSIVTVAKMEEESDWTASESTGEGQSSGAIISEDNNYLYILAEHKLVEDAAHIRVSFVDGAGTEATLFKYDGNTGIAILTVEKRQLKLDTKRAIAVAKMGSINEVKNGALVIALGSPLGTKNSISTGNITSVENEVMTQDNNYSIYTTDIPASKNGSGVLINTQGEIIGMMLQELNDAQEVSTLTAVAMSEIQDIILNLKNGKNIPYVGVYIATVTDDIAEDYDIPKGVFIREVVTDSPAMKAGLQNGDVITHINGDAMRNDEVFSEKISQLLPGTSCEVTVKRQNGNEYYEVKCTVIIGVLE